MKAAVIVFPGSNCDRDAQTALQSLGVDVEMVWHKDNSLPKVDLVVLPGGFSYGDYLRCGSMAAHSAVTEEVVKHADAGRYVLGICNGFQVLTELQLLPGTLLKNSGVHFVCDDITIKAENTDSAFTNHFEKEPIIRIPIAHHDGNYYVDENTRFELEENGQVAFRYCDEDGIANDNSNPNGSVENIAGVFNEKKNVLGMMPHPERACDKHTGGIDGKLLFQSLIESLK